MSRLLPILTSQLGRDAGEYALKQHPELARYSPAQQERVIAAVEMVLEGNPQLPITVENAERVFALLDANGEIEKIAGPLPAPKAAATENPYGSEGWKREVPLDELRAFLEKENPRGAR
jgi:hypothetical protein